MNTATATSEHKCQHAWSEWAENAANHHWMQRYIAPAHQPLGASQVTVGIAIVGRERHPQVPQSRTGHREPNHEGTRGRVDALGRGDQSVGRELAQKFVQSGPLERA
jgi:hypothetical protein